MINLKIDPEFQSQIPPLTDDEFKQLEENILKEGKLLSPLIVWGNTLVDGYNRYAILQKHPEICFSTLPLRFANREEALAWICKNQLGRRNLTPEQKKFLIGKQYSVEHRKPGGNGNNQYTATTQEAVQEELCQIDTIPPERLSEWLLYQFPDGILLERSLGFAFDVCLQRGKHCCLIELVTEMFRPDELCSSSRQIT